MNNNNNNSQMRVELELAIITLVGTVLSSVAAYIANNPTIAVTGIVLSVLAGLISGLTSLQAYLKGQQAAIGLNQPQPPAPINLQVNTPQAGNETTNISQGPGQGQGTTVTAKPAAHRRPYQPNPPIEPGPPPVILVDKGKLPPPTYPLDREG